MIMKRLFFHLTILLSSTLLLSCSTARISKTKEQKVLIQTTEGDITLKLYNETPLHRDNFIKLVKAKTYNGVLFHRVIKEFMIQGGDPNSKTAAPDMMLGEGDVGYTIPAEFKTPAIYHKYGALAAARESDDTNPHKVSSGCQFYIVVGKKFTDEQLDKMQESKIARYGHTNDSTYKFSAQARHDYKNVGGTPHLDGNYTVYGEVLKGMDVAEKISKVQTNSHDRPVKDIRIKKMKLIR
ncbi:MAG: putative peptidyl-prolyl cis-trans isomerase [Bacteroidetes bacterium ADurb.BinA174]|mgnify:CR=1 FL=1|jgi:cyclophilin family peptidyl-prolyl cis-trans isomerase|nr:MAG: putative peptidyl-prolyl cis-trans isomerase [Bacteroidetes bacterium ADurb.BinA174]